MSYSAKICTVQWRAASVLFYRTIDEHKEKAETWILKECFKERANISVMEHCQSVVKNDPFQYQMVININLHFPNSGTFIAGMMHGWQDQI